MLTWRHRELLASAIMAAIGAMWLTAAWTASAWAPAHNVAVKLAFAFASFAVVANPQVLFERASLERLFGSRAPEAIAFGLLATLGIFCAIAAVGAWLLDPLLPD